MLFLNTPPQRIDSGATPTFAGVLGSNGQSILGNSSGAWAITANGTNQNITLTPSGTGYLSVASPATATSVNIARFLIPSQGTSATLSQGAYATVGQDNSAYNCGVLQFGYIGAGNTSNAFGFSVFGVSNGLWLNDLGRVMIGSQTDSGALFQVNGTATFAGTIQPQLATTAGAPAYVKGAIYFDTTLNKLRVGGASAWETITSV